MLLTSNVPIPIMGWRTLSRQYRLLPFQLLKNCSHANKLQVESHEENKSHHPGKIEGTTKNSTFKPLNNAHLAHTNQPSRPGDQRKPLTMLLDLCRLVWADHPRELGHRHSKSPETAKPSKQGRRNQIWNGSWGRIGEPKDRHERGHHSIPEQRDLEPKTKEAMVWKGYFWERNI